MTYSITYRERVVEEDFPFLDHAILLRIKTVIDDKLTRDPVRFGKPLQYDLRGCRALRVGDYRVIYEADALKKTVGILRVGHRRDIYEQ